MGCTWRRYTNCNGLRSTSLRLAGPREGSVHIQQLPGIGIPGRRVYVRQPYRHQYHIATFWCTGKPPSPYPACPRFESPSGVGLLLTLLQRSYFQSYASPTPGTSSYKYSSTHLTATGLAPLVTQNPFSTAVWYSAVEESHYLGGNWWNPRGILP